MPELPGWKIFLHSGRRLEIRKEALRLGTELDHGKWLCYEVDGLPNRIRVAEIESVHRLIELPASVSTSEPDTSSLTEEES